MTDVAQTSRVNLKLKAARSALPTATLPLFRGVDASLYSEFYTQTNAMEVSEYKISVGYISKFAQRPERDESATGCRNAQIGDSIQYCSSST